MNLSISSPSTLSVPTTTASLDSPGTPLSAASDSQDPEPGQSASVQPDPEVRQHNLSRLFAPRSVVVVGASADPGKRGNHALRSLVKDGFPGPIYGINPKGGQAHGIDFISSITELPDDLDLALLAIGAPHVPNALRELAARGVAAAVVLANGFAEVGTSQGRALEAEVRAIARDTGLRIVGPNTSGIINMAQRANLVGLPDVRQGPISVVTQSGNMLLSLVNDDKAHRGPGLATYIGLGNQADIDYADCVQALAEDPNTGAIALHAEGIKDGRAFLTAAARHSAAHPILMLRGGRSEVGQRAAMSHTGSVAGADNVATRVLAQTGVELVDRSDELAVIAGVLACAAAMPHGTGLAILSDGGGHATLAADALERHAVPLAPLREETVVGLGQTLGPTASLSNPIDVAGATDTAPELFADAVDQLLADPGVGAVLVIGLYGGYHLRFDPRLEDAENRAAERIVERARAAGKPVLVQSCYATSPIENHELLRQGGVPVLASIDHATRAIAALHRRGTRLATADQRSHVQLPPPVRWENLPDGLLPEPLARRLIEEAGIDIGPWREAKSAEELTSAIADIGSPCAVKVVSPQVVHKSDVGGVALNVTEHNAGDTWTDIHTSVTGHVPEARITSMVAAPMSQPGVELLVGATRDPIYGPVVAFGLGGIMVEALRDVSFRAAPFTTLEAHELINETIAARLLDGYRSFPPVHRERLAELLVRVGDFIATHPQVAELDLNPVIARGSEVLPVDVRIITTSQTSQENA